MKNLVKLCSRPLSQPLTLTSYFENLEAIEQKSITGFSTPSLKNPQSGYKNRQISIQNYFIGTFYLKICLNFKFRHMRLIPTNEIYGYV